MKTKLMLALVVTLFFAQLARAGTASGKVTRTYVLSCPSAAAQSTCAIGIVMLNTPNPSPPGCAIHPGWAFSIDTAAGKAMFNAILQAQAVGATVTVVGDGTCGAWGDRERPNYIFVDYPQ